MNTKIKESKVSKMNKAWAALGDMPVNDDMELESSWEGWPVGSCCIEIWQWFEEEYQCCAYDLMYPDEKQQNEGE